MLNAQVFTLIPDPNFEQALIDLDIDSDSTVNGKVLTADINTITELNIFDYNIEDLAGIENFDSLRTLNCFNNHLTSFDISSNTNLTDLNCSGNLLDSLDVSANTSLEKLDCSGNLLTILDVSTNSLLKNLDFSSNQISIISISNNNSLISLRCSNNRLKDLYVSSNTVLEELMCSSNQIQNLNLTNNTLLRSLLCASNQIDSLNLLGKDSLSIVDCSNNQLRTLNVSSNLVLTNLSCSDNQLASLNISIHDSLTFLSCSNNLLKILDVSNNTVLENLICASNQLTGLDVSNSLALASVDMSSNLITSLNVSSNIALTSLYCSDNQLTDLDISNGQNGLLELFNATNNPDLRCIRVDDPAAANNYPGWLKDGIATYNLECVQTTYVPDDNFEAALAAYDDIADDDLVPTANIDTLTYLDISNLNISDLTGIEDFLALDSLDCSLNFLSNLDMTQQEFLAYLDCSGNLLQGLTLRNEMGGIFTYMDATNNPFLTCIQVEDVAAAIAEINWLKDTIATYNLDCTAGKTYVPDDNFEQFLIDNGYDSGSLDDWVVTANISTLQKLNVSGQNIFSLEGIQAFTSLDTLNCSLNNLSALNVSSNTALKELYCYSNYLTTLDVQADTLLTKLVCSDNRLSTLDLSKNPDLLHLSCDANELAILDVSQNKELLSLYCSSNNIRDSLNITENTKLKELDCSMNKLTSINVSQNTRLEDLTCADNLLTDLNLLNDTALIKLDCSVNYLTSLDVSQNVKLEDVNVSSNQIDGLNHTTNTQLENLSCDNNQLTTINVTSNGLLRTLYASNNYLQVLNVSNNPLLRELSCNANQLSSLNISSNDSLKLLSCKNNELASLILSNNLLLETLDCDYNHLSSLNLGVNISLIDLSCSDNNLGILDVSSNLLLKFLSVNNNQLIELKLSTNNALDRLSCTGNFIVTLDLSKSTQLTSLNGSSNQLISVNVKNGNNTQMSSFFVTDNPDLTCIEVDDTAFANSAPGWTKDEIASYSLDCRYDETYIPDDSFEQTLIIMGFDSGPLDDYVTTNAIDTITNLDISGESISDLTGIHGFVALEYLNISSNQIDSLDLSNNATLTTLNCSNNQLDSLILSDNLLLEVLDFSSNMITEIDLKGHTSLSSLACNSNELTILDLMDNVSLTTVSCKSNQLTSINIQNGTNTNITSFDATNNPDLTCIEVDDTVFSISAPGWDKDAIASYSLDCHYNETYVPDDAFEQTLKDMGYDDSRTDPLDDFVPTPRITNITILYISNKGISELTGIEDFVNLVTLDCRNNSLTTLDFNGNDSLKYLSCSGNQLTDINISYNTALIKLRVGNNMLTSLDISANSNLTELHCSSNQLTAIDIIQNHNLTVFDCSLNQLVSVDANNGYNDIITSFNLTDNPNLGCVLVDDVAAAQGYVSWFIDPWSEYRTECNDDDNDGVPDLEDLCLTTPFGDFVDLFGCSVFSLPADNFTIITTSETCRSSNNGMISIIAVQNFNYNATIIGGILNDTINFTDDVEIRNLRAGTYDLCLTIDDVTNYLNCYEIVITEPEDLSVLSSFDPSNETIFLQLSGGINYTIDFNGLIFKTQDRYITLNLDNGENTISVKADAECQGTYEETIFLSNDVVFYPNPFEDFINVFVGNYDSKEVHINVYSYLGPLVLSKNYPIQNGSISIDASHLGTGIYFVSLRTGDIKSTFKIVKK